VILILLMMMMMRHAKKIDNKLLGIISPLDVLITLFEDADKMDDISEDDEAS
jgi:hypothetical protein